MPLERAVLLDFCIYLDWIAHLCPGIAQFHDLIAQLGPLIARIQPLMARIVPIIAQLRKWQPDRLVQQAVFIKIEYVPNRSVIPWVLGPES